MRRTRFRHRLRRGILRRAHAGRAHPADHAGHGASRGGRRRRSPRRVAAPSL